MYNMEVIYPTLESESVGAAGAAGFLRSLTPTEDGNGYQWSQATWAPFKLQFQTAIAAIILAANSNALAAIRGTYPVLLSQIGQNYVSALGSLAEIADSLQDSNIVPTAVATLFETMAIILNQLSRGENASATILVYSLLVEQYPNRANSPVWAAFALLQAGFTAPLNSTPRR